MDPTSSSKIPRNLAHGRSRQKLRTRNVLLAAARELIAQGTTPNVEDAASASSISRTTAYRYFRNQAELLAAAHPLIETRSLLPENAPTDVAARLDIVVKEITRNVIAAEAQYRAMLRLSLEEAPAREQLVLRQGRAIGWIEDALAPLRPKLSKAELRRLVLAIRAAIGIEALAWLTDVAGLSRSEAVKNMHWSARALLGWALAESKRS